MAQNAENLNHVCLALHKAAFSSEGKNLTPLDGVAWEVMAGEPGKVLDQTVFDDIALVLMDNWEKRECIKPGSEKDILGLHKKEHEKEIGSYVEVLPDGQVIVIVLPIAAMHNVVFPQTSHAVIFWNAESQKWHMDGFNYLVKLGALSEAIKKPEIDIDTVMDQVCNTKPTRVKEFGKLANAMNEAQEFVHRGSLYSARREEETGVATQHKKDARHNFHELPQLLTLDPIPNVMSEYALELARSVPNILALHELIDERQKLN